MARVEKNSEQLDESPLRSPDIVQEGCINLDTESEAEEEHHNVPKRKDAAQEIKIRQQESEDDDDEDFVLVKRQVKRKR